MYEKLKKVSAEKFNKKGVNQAERAKAKSILKNLVEDEDYDLEDELDYVYNDKLKKHDNH